ncbi:hypothetical protein BDF21DRAFT_408791 [Thamnidium elegans]|nr:hypothetical protein BDF21DRAFT_408791 [Thamnidium elegans]
MQKKNTNPLSLLYIASFSSFIANTEKQRNPPILPPLPLPLIIIFCIYLFHF